MNVIGKLSLPTTCRFLVPLILLNQCKALTKESSVLDQDGNQVVFSLALF